jgi:uncharacterized protein YycO
MLMSSPEPRLLRRYPRSMTTTVPPVGLIGLTQISGEVGKLIEIGQWLNGDGFKTWEHAFISIGSGLIVEAEPGGARVAHSSEYSDIHWCYGLYKLLDTPAKIAAAEDAAKSFVGVPYSFLDYFALAGKRLHLPHMLLQDYVSSTGHMICSQLDARAYWNAGGPIYPEWTGYVTPMDLYNRDVQLGGQKVAGL